MVLNRVAQKAGYELSVKKIHNLKECENSLNLNIGAGDYQIPGFKSLDLYTPHYYKSKKAFSESRINFDLRKDAIPFGNNTVDNIYVSHVIEHVEDFAVESLFKEAHRVLRIGGTLRIACPDSKFLYKVCQFKNNYWNWRKSLVEKPKRSSLNSTEIEPYGYLIRELATPRSNLSHSFASEKAFSVESANSYDYKQLTESLRNGLAFRPEFPGDHINNWDYKRLGDLGMSIGFSRVIESKCQGSVSAEMQGPMFDKTEPQMSLYVDFVK